MQSIAARFHPSILAVALCAIAPLAMADSTQLPIKTHPTPVDQVLGHASGEPYFQTRPEIDAPKPVRATFEEFIDLLKQPPHLIPPDRFGRGGGNLPPSS